MPRTPDFYSHLDAKELAQFEAFAREPKHKISHCHEWLAAKGIITSKSAVQRWKHRFDETDRMSAAAELAAAIHTASAEGGTVDVAAAVNLQLAQRLQTALVKGGDRLEMGDLLKGAMAISALTSAQGKLNELKRIGREQMEQLKSKAKSGVVITPEMIEQASKAFFG
ncbi:MAG TPA: hypothetical protein VF624_15015 [Tepidisphaeraceae bacterium]